MSRSVPEEDEYEEDRGRTSAKKRRRSDFIGDDAVVDVDEEDDDEDYEEYGGGKGRAAGRHKAKKKAGSQFLDIEAMVDSDEEEEEEEGEDGFIVESGADLPDEDGGRRMHRRPILPREEEQEDIENLERKIKARYARRSHTEYYGEETTDLEQQALLPSVKDPKLWMVKCQIGHERDVAFCLMQKRIDKGSELKIRSAVALDHLKNYIYIEADEKYHVIEAIHGMRNIIRNQKILMVPIKEMTHVLSAKSEGTNISRKDWVIINSGTYKGDLAQVEDLDNVKLEVMVKLIPRIDLKAIANRMEGKEVVKKNIVPPQGLMSIDKARELNIRVERRRDKRTGDYFESIEGKLFKDGFFFKPFSMKSISPLNRQPTIDELEKFQKPGENGDGEIGRLSTSFANIKKGHFRKGDAVIIVKGDLKSLTGRVEKVDDENVSIRPDKIGPEMKDLPETIAVYAKELCKYFKIGNRVKIVTGVHEGTTGTVLKVEQRKLILLSDTTNEDIHVFADDVESSEVTTGVTKLGDYELHDLVLLDDTSFGVIIRVESEAFQVLKGIPERPSTAVVKLREIKYKLDRKYNAADRNQKVISVKDVVRIVEGPTRGTQGPVEHIYKGVLFINNRDRVENAGFICAKSRSCILVGGGPSRTDRKVDSFPRHVNYTNQPTIPSSPRRPSNEVGGRGGGRDRRRGHDSFIGKSINIRRGYYKGYRGRVKNVKGDFVQVELDSQTNVVTVELEAISDNTFSTTNRSDAPRYGMGSETPMHPSRTPLHPYMTPMRDPGATPIHDGMRTPIHNRAWNPYAPMSPNRSNWEDTNPASWGTSPHPRSPPFRTYAPTPGPGWANTPGSNYSDAGTPRDETFAYANAPGLYLPSTPGQPMTPNSGSYLPGTPIGQPMTPGTGGLDMMSPVIGGDTEVASFMPDILVDVHKAGETGVVGIIREVLQNGSCKVVVGSGGDNETRTALPSEMTIVAPKKAEHIKIIGGVHRGATGKLIGIDGGDRIVRVDESFDVQILDASYVAVLAK